MQYLHCEYPCPQALFPAFQWCTLLTLKRLGSLGMKLILKTCVYCRPWILNSLTKNILFWKPSLYLTFFASTPSSLFHAHEELNLPTLLFKKWKLNRQYALQPDKEFKFYLACILLLFVVIYLTQAIMLYRYVHACIHAHYFVMDNHIPYF